MTNDEVENAQNVKESLVGHGEGCMKGTTREESSRLARKKKE